MSPAAPRRGSGSGRGRPPSGGARGRGGGPSGSGSDGRRSGRSGGRDGSAKGGRGRGPAPTRGRGSGQASSRGTPTGGRDAAARPAKTKLVPTRSTRAKIGVPRSQAAGRTGAIGGGDPHPARGGKGLGGDQIEGRQAIRELLLAGQRKVHEIWLSSELADDEGVADIVELARANRVPVASVARNKLEARARSEAPQGVIAYAAELPEADLADLVRRRSSSPSTG